MKKITAEELDKKFDDGEDISEYIDWSTAYRPGLEGSKRVNVDLPLWMVKALDREATRLGVTRQSLIKMWTGNKLDALRAEQRVVAAPVAKQLSSSEAA